MNYNESLYYLFNGVLVEKSNRPTDMKVLIRLREMVREMVKRERMEAK